MSTYTENYNLIKPDETDYYNVQDFNENMDLIDAQLLAEEQSIENVGNKIGSPTDENNKTVFSKLNTIEEALAQRTSIIKSIQYVTVSIASNNSSTKKEINMIDPSKTFVILERLSDPGGTLNVSYTLNHDNIVVTTTNNAGYLLLFGFWIIEFN